MLSSFPTRDNLWGIPQIMQKMQRIWIFDHLDTLQLSFTLPFPPLHCLNHTPDHINCPLLRVTKQVLALFNFLQREIWHIKGKQLQFQEQKLQFYSLNILKMLNNPSNPVANFVHKTFQILRSSEYHSIIDWLSNGKEFLIKDSEAFENQILPKYFRHRNVNSFIRQLNMYGFHKSRREPNKLIFSHPFFLQGRDDLLNSVRRKLKNDEKEENEDFEKQEEKYEIIEQQPTKSSLYQVGQAIDRSMEDVSTTIKAISNQSIFQEENPAIREDQRSFFAINSFFNIDYENIQLKNLMSKSYIFDNSAQIYQRLEEGPSLKEIGTEEYLNYCDRNMGPLKKKGQGFDLQNLAIRLFQTKNCMFELDI